MKYLKTFFLFLFFFSIPFFCLAQEDLPAPLKKALPILKQTSSFLEQLQKKVSESPFESSQKTSLDSSLSFLYANQESPLTGLRGIGTWQKTPFGYVRLVSNYAGIQGVRDIYLLWQAYILPPHKIQIPVLRFDLSDSSAIIDSFIPKGRPLWKNESPYFQNLLSIPIHIHLSRPQTEPLNIQASVDVPFCESECTPIPTLSTLSLDLIDNKPTLLDAFIQMAYYNLQTLVDDEKIKAVVLEDGDIFIEVHSQNTLLKASVLLSGDKIYPYEIVYMHFLKKQGHIRLKPKERLLNKKITITVDTQHEFMENTVLLKQGQESFFPKARPQTPWLRLLLLFILFNPIWLIFLNSNFGTEKQVQQFALKSILKLLITAFAAFLFLRFYPLPDVWNSYLWLCFIIILLSFFYYRPHAPNFEQLLILSLCIPAFYLQPLFQKGYFFALILLYFITILPFVLSYFFPFSTLRSTYLCRTAPIYVKRFSLILNIVWTSLMIFSLAIFDFYQMPTASQTAIKKTMEEKKIAWVVCGEPYNIYATMSFLFQRQTTLIQGLENKINFYTCPLGKPVDFLKNVPNQPTQYLFGSQKPQGVELPFYLQSFWIVDYINAAL